MRQNAPQLHRALNALLAKLDARAAVPPLWARSGAPPTPAQLGAPPRLYGAEFLEIDAAAQEVTCTKEMSTGGWASCATQWHIDGGRRTYKLWGLLSRAESVDGAALARAGLSPTAAPAEHSNLVVAPFDHVQRLCDIALELNASYTGDRAAAAASIPRRGQTVHQFVTDASGGNGGRDEEQLEIFARVADEEVLEEVGCVLDVERGDVVLLFPDLFHRTQDLAVDRLAFNAEAF
eukprot:7271028-Prymnesium_polylepis.1